MDKLSCLHVAEDDNVTVVNALPMISVLVTRLYDEAHKFGTLRIKFDHVACLVDVGTVFGALKERLAVIVQQLHFVTVLHNFTLAAL